MSAQNIEQSSAPSAYITGSTQYDPVELLRFAAEHVIAVGEEPTAQNLANAISLIYREDGVTLAETTYHTDTQTGNIEFFVTERYFSNVVVGGLSPSTEKRVRSYTQMLIGRVPPRQRDLERSLMLSSDLAGVSIASEIAADDRTVISSTLRITGV